MVTQTQFSSRSHFSLRGMLALVFVCCLAVAAFRFGGILAEIFVTLVALIFIAAAVRSVVAEGAGRQVALGFLTPAVFYVALLSLLGQGEISDFGRFPTSKAIHWCYSSLGGPMVSPDVFPPGSLGGIQTYGGVGYGYEPLDYVSGTGLGSGTPKPLPTPPVANLSAFMVVGHCLVCLVLALAGSIYATYLLRRAAGQTSQGLDSRA